MWTKLLLSLLALHAVYGLAPNSKSTIKERTGSGTSTKASSTGAINIR
jgi:hypothetical protein